jgi:hypothetical protein
MATTSNDQSTAAMFVWSKNAAASGTPEEAAAFACVIVDRTTPLQRGRVAALHRQETP